MSKPVNRIGERIKKVRLDQRMTQTDFGSYIGVKGNTVTGYETGVRIPSDSIINNICKTFRVNETWLRTGDLEVDMYIPASNDGDPLRQLFDKYNCTRLEMTFLTAYFGLKADERMEFCKLIRKMFPEAISKIVDGDPLERIFNWEEAVPIEDVDSLAEKAAELVREQAKLEEKTESLA